MDENADFWCVVKGSVRAAAYLFVTLLVIPPQLLLNRFSFSKYWIVRSYHKLCAKVVGINIDVRGVPSTKRPTLFVANHVSYLDITVLGALLEGSFVAKSDVADWPFFGLLAKLQSTVFIERRNRAKVGKQANDIVSRLQSGDNLILFPEGTSSDGNRTLPFKSALFAVASARVGRDGSPITIQPISLTPTLLDGLPMGIARRPLYAWYGDMDLAPHLWRVFLSGPINVTVEFHEPVTLETFASRKSLADHCQQRVALGVSRALAGREA